MAGPRLRVSLAPAEGPELGMIPAKIMPAAVPVFTDSRPQPLHLREEFLMTEAVQILIHRILAPCHSVVTRHGADFNAASLGATMG